LGEALEKTSVIAWSDRTSGEKLQRNAEFAVEFFGSATTLDNLTADRLDDYATHLLNRGNSNATVNRKLAAVSRMLSLAVQRGKLQKKPLVPRRRESEGRIRFLSEAEEARCLSVLGQWGKDDHQDVFVVLVDTGMRSSEVFRLEARDCDLDRGLLSAWQTKNGRPRSIPMTDRVRAIVARRVATGASRVFPFDNAWLDHLWSRLRGHLELTEDKQFVPYALRHTCASRLVQRGVGIRVVQEWLGHRNISVTLRYAHLCPSNLLDAVKVLNG
jgi:integrase